MECVQLRVVSELPSTQGRVADAHGRLFVRIDCVRIVGV